MDQETGISGVRPWYRRAFGPLYGRVYPHRDLAEARRDVAFLASLGLAGPVLDLACGAGRHLEALAERGLTAWGLDLSPDQLAVCPRRGHVVRADHRRLPMAGGSVGTALSLFTSFGYLPDAAEDGAVLAEAARVLAPGGALVLDLPGATRLRQELVPRSEQCRDGLVIRSTRTLTEGGRRVVKRVEVLAEGAPGGGRGGGATGGAAGPVRVAAWHEDVRLYERAELEELLVGAGLRPAGAWGDLAGAPWAADAPRLVLLARRA